MGRRVVAPPGAAAGGPGGGAPPAATLFVNGRAEPWDAESGEPAGPASPSAKTSKPHTKQAVTAAVRRALFSPGRRSRRQRLAACTAALAGLLLLGAWAHGLLGGSTSTSEQQLSRQPAGGVWLQDGQGNQAKGAAAAQAAAGLVEFTAPGLFLPLRDALDVSLIEQPAEAALLRPLPPAVDDPADAAAGQGASKRPTLADVLQQMERDASAAGRTVAAVGQGKPQGGGKTGKPGAAGAALPATAGGQAGGVPDSPADMANAIQSAIQQVEEEARRQCKARQRAQMAGEGGGVAAGSTGTGRAELQAAASGSGDAGPGSTAGAASNNSAAGGRGVRMLLGVISACCSEKAQLRRAAIRETWGRTIRESFPGVDLRFFLAQPPTPEAVSAWLAPLQEELAAHGDLVVLRGRDEYRNLPNKTVRFLRYALAHPAGYTHAMKTDDDCFVRMHRVLAALRDPLDAAGHIQPQMAWAADGGAAMQGSLASAQRSGTGVGATGSTGQQSGVGGQAAEGAIRQQLWQAMGRTDGTPMFTDGIQVYNATGLIRAAGGATVRRSVDDEMGEPVTLAQPASDAAEAARQHRAAKADARRAVGSGSSSSQGLPQAANHRPAQPLLPPRKSGVYMGCMENKGGFFPIRDKVSKWYLSYEELPDAAVPFSVKYLAGWGVVLSRDLVEHAVRKANLFDARPAEAPAWFRVPFEDVLLGMLLMDAVQVPQDHPTFRAAWRACSANTAVKHLDVDAPRLFKGLHEQDLSGLWDVKPVQCSTAQALPGDYQAWKAWRDALKNVERI